MDHVQRSKAVEKIAVHRGQSLGHLIGGQSVAGACGGGPDDGGDGSFDFYRGTRNAALANGAHTTPRLGA